MEEDEPGDQKTPARGDLGLSAPPAQAVDTTRIDETIALTSLDSRKELVSTRSWVMKKREGARTFLAYLVVCGFFAYGGIALWIMQLQHITDTSNPIYQFADKILTVSAPLVGAVVFAYFTSGQGGGNERSS
jgi:hypothetical protein